MASFEEYEKLASDKGMYLVDHQNIEPLIEEFYDSLEEADKLCEVIDPEDTPFKSKYEAREILDKLANKFEATKTILNLEGKFDIISKEIEWRYCSVRVRIGNISYDVEEPHNCQTELEYAFSYFLPQFLEKINDVTIESQGSNCVNIDNDIASLPNVASISIGENSIADALKCTSMLGILWAGRDQIKKSFLYLLTAKNLYNHWIQIIKDSKKRVKLENLYTHNLFYLAQAYGHIGKPQESCKYCHETLNRQLIAGVDGKAALEWVKNAMGIADFHMVMNKFKTAAHALGAAEYILYNKVINNNKNELQDVAEILGDLHRRWLRLDVNIYKDSIEKLNALTLHDLSLDKLSISQTGKCDIQDINYKFTGLDIPSISFVKDFDDDCNDSNSNSKMIFPVIQSSQDAVEVFKRSYARADEAKKIFLLDGYVTDHVRILQDQSKLYHYLSSFETEPKRKLAMQSRRLEILKPLLLSLNYSAFDTIHKEISYECAECFMNLLDIKLEKFKSKSDGEVDIHSLKNAEIKKLNEYCCGGLIMVDHFLNIYSNQGEQINSFKKYENVCIGYKQLNDLTESICKDPIEANIVSEEVRLYLNAHFLAARFISKFITKNEEIDAVFPFLSALKIYTWLTKNASKLCESKSLQLDNVFGNELMVCKEMVSLLPSKIDRVHFRR